MRALTTFSEPREKVGERVDHKQIDSGLLPQSRRGPRAIPGFVLRVTFGSGTVLLARRRCGMRTRDAPGLALRLTALAAAGAALLAVVSGTLGGGTPHKVLAALALPPLLALVVAAAVAHRRLLGAGGGRARPVARGRADDRALGARGARGPRARGDRGAGGAHVSRRQVARGSVRDYVTLTKPRIMTLLLLTGACGMIVGARGMPAPGQFGLMLLGLALACGGASALNHVLDRDIDRLMGPRTASRPVAAGRMTAPRALEFGLALMACSFVLLGSTVNVLTATLALAGGLFYVVVYTGYLKRRGPGNIVLGGAAGAVPPLVGFAAATGNLALPARLAVPDRLPVDAAALLVARAAPA